MRSAGPHLIVALDDRAFAIVVNGEDADSAVAIELPPTSDCSGDKNKDDIVKQKGDSGPEIHAEAKNAVQAVSLMVSLDGSEIVCAVSRSDKTLSLHCISVDAVSLNTSPPFAIHKLPKRACCLDLTRVSAASGDEKHSIDIVIAGDLSGDVTAYPASKSTCEAGGDIGTSRLLLGHTATMVSSVRVVEDSGVKRVFSSDRDEKVRISGFPQTFALEGFLLGHTAFIVSLDVALKDGCTRCVTCSGDGTVRLWDYSSCKELATLEAVMTNCTPSDSEKESADMTHASDKAAVDVKSRDSEVLIPIAAAINFHGNMIAVVRDGFDSVDIYVVSGSNSSPSVSKKQSLKCSSQPLSVIFLQSGDLCVLTMNPDFILQYSPKKNGSGEVALNKRSSLFYSALECISDRKGITMPTTVLETDQNGQLKLSKKDKEKPGFHKHEPWNRIERVEKARNASSRRKKRKHMEREKNA